LPRKLVFTGFTISGDRNIVSAFFYVLMLYVVGVKFCEFVEARAGQAWLQAGPSSTTASVQEAQGFRRRVGLPKWAKPSSSQKASTFSSKSQTKARLQQT